MDSTDERGPTEIEIDVAVESLDADGVSEASSTPEESSADGSRLGISSDVLGEGSSADDSRAETSRNGSENGGDGLADGTPAGELEAELGRYHVRTTADGYVEGHVTGVESVDETTVGLSVALPTDEQLRFQLEKPVPWSAEFLFARIVEDVGYDAASVSHLVGERVYLTRVDGPGDVTGDGRSILESAMARAVEESRFGWALAIPFEAWADTQTPQWRLVDPLERPDSEPDTDGFPKVVTVGVMAVLAGVAAAVAGVLWSTGATVTATAILTGAMPGVALVLLGLLVLRQAHSRPPGDR